MNTLFADWLRPVTLDFAGVDLPARTQAADAMADEAVGDRVLDLVAISYGAPVQAERVAAVRAQFKESEPAFPMRDNDPEMQVLAAAVLEQICRAGEPTLRVFASYAVTVAEHQWLTCPLPELPAAAADAIAELAVSRRQARTKPEVKPLAPDKDLKAALDSPGTTTGYASEETTKATFQALTTWTEAALQMAATQAQAVADWADHNAQLAAEDSQLLWWLISGSSSTLGEPWSSLPARALAVLAGRELASAAVVLPAPPQSDALLQQLIAANAQRTPASEAPIGALDSPEELAFLIADLAVNDGRAPVDVARHSLDQTMLVRAWNELE